MAVNLRVQQRTDYTFKFNKTQGRHGWLRLTPAYSLKVVKEILREHDPSKKVLDPFMGTGTTPLSAAYLGYQNSGAEINPFLYWLSKTKTAEYSEDAIDSAYQYMCSGLERLIEGKVDPVKPPPLYNIDRWWSGDKLLYLRLLKSLVDSAPAKNGGSDLLLVAFCRFMIKMSNAAFNHQSMSFKEGLSPEVGHKLNDRSIKAYSELFKVDLEFVMESARFNPYQCPSRLELGDSRHIDSLLGNENYDLVITSPPYANRISYIRELRPYMYWLGLIREAREAAEFDWQAIGGTWGAATSRLAEWVPTRLHEFAKPYFYDILKDVGRDNNKSGVLMANYIAKYFEDIWSHFNSLRKVLAKGAKVHYIVGNSTFYGVLVPTEKLYGDMLAALGFRDISITVIRKRNSKKELFEYDVSAYYG